MIGSVIRQRLSGLDGEFLQVGCRSAKGKTMASPIREKLCSSRTIEQKRMSTDLRRLEAREAESRPQRSMIGERPADGDTSRSGTVVQRGDDVFGPCSAATGR